jgi:hypothetical protein
MLFRQWFTSLATLSREYNNFKGIIIDDFGEYSFWEDADYSGNPDIAGKWLDANGERVYSPDYLAQLQADIKEQNPSFRFGAVLYYPYMSVSLSQWQARSQYIDDVVYAGWWSKGNSPLITEDTGRIERDYIYQRDLLLKYMRPQQRMWYCPYITSHSWQGASTTDDKVNIVKAHFDKNKVQ